MGSESVLAERIQEQTPVAKKKKAVKPEPTKQRSLVVLKGSEEFGGWMKRLSGHLGLQVTSTIDIALKQLAETSGFKEPMPKRRKV